MNVLKNLTWGSLEKSEVKNKNISVVVYRIKCNTDDKWQTAVYIGFTKTDIGTLYGSKDYAVITTFTYSDYVEFPKGSYKSNGAENIPIEFAIKEMGKYFSG